MTLVRRLVPGRPGAIDKLLGEIGPVWGEDIRTCGDRVKAAYAPLLAAASKEGVTVMRDVPYGRHPRQVLDVYRPIEVRNAPVVMFVHGGAFVRGSKDISDDMYGNVLVWFARQGCVAVNVEYRLAVDAPFPGGALDVGAASAWVREHIASFGGDSSRICLIGHSAGGTHAASYAFDPSLGFLGREIACLVLISARLRADVSQENPNAEGVRAYFGDDPGLYDERSPVSHAASSRVPTFIVTAEYENPLLDLYGLETACRMAASHRRAPRFLCLPTHNHVSIMAHFNTGETELGEAILDFFARASER